MTKKHVAVLMGGFSSERPVSLVLRKCLRRCAGSRKAIRVTRVDVGRDVGSVLAELKPDVAFNALHGPFGEDGTIQGILEYLAIPYTHSGVLASALAMNKEQAKKVAKAAGIPVAESKVLNRFAIARQASDEAALCGQAGQRGVELRRRHRQGGPVASAAGHRLVANGNMATPSWSSATSHGRELTCAVMGDVALGVTEIIPVGPFLLRL